MSQIITRIISENLEWERFLSMHPEANFLQSWLWGEFHKNLGHKIIRTGFFENTKLIGAMLVIIEEAKRARYMVIPGGPILDWKNTSLTKTFAEELRKLGKNNNCVFARVRPQLLESTESKNLFKGLGFASAPMYLHAELTSQLDITKSEDELLSNMRKATRYEIKQGIKLGIKIEENGDSNLNNFYALQIETAKRQKFVPFSKKFLETQFQTFIKAGSAILYTARHEGKVLAQAFVIFYGTEAVYHYGASTQEGRNYPGAYLIQWKAIMEAKKRGMTRYNFWGVSPENSSDHRFSGLSLFKRGFGGSNVQYLPAQDLILNKRHYFLNFLVEKARRSIRHS